MNSYHWNGEYWFKRDWGVLKRVRHWLIWIGGWEEANGAGWHFRYDDGRRWRDPFPISLLGHRATFYSWGFELKTKHGYVVYSKSVCDGNRLYVSLDGTPAKAHTWFIGTPQEIEDRSRQVGESAQDYYKRLDGMVRNLQGQE